MNDPDGAQRAREWLERQLAELGQLRNASRRDPGFKNWRQQTLTVIQRVWPGDSRRVDRFRRIPFSPPTGHSTDRQVREYYERGWGEAGVLMREFLAEINLLGLPQVHAAGTYAGSETEEAMGAMPSLAGPQARPRAVTPPADSVPPPAPGPGPEDGGFGDDIGRAMDRLLGRSPAVRGPAPEPAPIDPGPGLDSPAAELARVADELEELGLDPERARPVRATLLALARAARQGSPPWELVSDALAQAGTTPALARRVLPLLLEFIATAA
jgi:hypothetical protein